MAGLPSYSNEQSDETQNLIEDVEYMAVLDDEFSSCRPRTQPPLIHFVINNKQARVRRLQPRKALISAGDIIEFVVLHERLQENFWRE